MRRANRFEERETAKATAAGKADAPIDPKAKVNFTDEEGG
jgi:hypothetical protein